MILVLLLLFAGETRLYHHVTVAQLPTTPWTHVSVCGVVALVKSEADGDTHIRLEDGKAFLVAEFVPYHPLSRPKVGQHIRITGISRIDRTHTTKEYPGGWPEVHPVESLTIVEDCANTKRVKP